MDLRLSKYILILVIGLLLSTSASATIEPMVTHTHTGDGVITLFNTHSSEFESIQYKTSEGQYLEDGINQINYMFRCSLNNEEADIELGLIELLDEIQDHFKASQVQIVSGYRSPEYNNMLRAKGRRVAKESFHMSGFAVDLRIPGVPLSKVRDFARSMHAGGVGYYPRRFVHLDVGPERHW